MPEPERCEKCGRVEEALGECIPILSDNGRPAARYCLICLAARGLATAKPGMLDGLPWDRIPQRFHRVLRRLMMRTRKEQLDAMPRPTGLNRANTGRR